MSEDPKPHSSLDELFVDDVTLIRQSLPQHHVSSERDYAPGHPALDALDRLVEQLETLRRHDEAATQDAVTFRRQLVDTQEQLEALRVALQEIAEDRVPTTYGGGARAMRVRANHALSDLSNPAKEYEYVEDTAEGRWGTASSPASSRIEMSEDEKRIRAELEAENAETRERVAEALDPASEPEARNLDGTNHWTPHDDPRGIGR